MKYIRKYKLFESRDGLTDEQREFLDKNTYGTFNKNTRGTWSVNSEGLVDVQGSFWCDSQELEDFLGIRFGKVSGSFFCDDNQLRTLEGAPIEVGRNFRCDGNQLRNLKGSPRVVRGSFSCNGIFSSRDRQLRTLEGAPREVGGNFDCDGNQLRTLEGSPRKIGGGFWGYKNPLISLEGAPEVIKLQFRFKNTRVRYNLQSFLEKIDWLKVRTWIEPSEISLLLTHHFFTPEVIKEQITQNPDFPYYVSFVWNTEVFKQKQEVLKKILPENILVKIEDLKF